MFGDERNYGNYKVEQKLCGICNEPLKIYTTCDNCQRHFCYHHRDLFVNHWTCPICKENFKSFSNFQEPLKQANVTEFLKRLA